MKTILKPALAAATLALSACSGLGAGESGWSSYTAAPVRRTQVADGTLSVAPPRPWNRQRSSFFEDIRQTEDWTLNGPFLDGISFVGGLKNGQYIVRQRRSESQQVPKFRSEMTPPISRNRMFGMLRAARTRPTAPAESEMSSTANTNAIGAIAEPSSETNRAEMKIRT